MSTDRFKFRVWDKANKKYLEEMNLADIGCAFRMNAFERCDCFSFDEVIVEQCTGLCDKNGNLIYEGDVVSWPMSHPSVGFVEWNEKKFKFCLKTYTFYMQEGLLGNPGEADLCEFEEFLLMGNIHEAKWRLGQ